MPRHDITLNLPGFTVKKIRGYDPVFYIVNYRRVVRCPHCCSKDLRKKDKYLREVEHVPIGERRSVLLLESYKYHCRNCKRYFRQRFEGILPWQRSTEPFKKYIYHLHKEGLSRSSLSKSFKKSDNTICKFYNYVYNLEIKKLKNISLPRVLGIDEHYFSKRNKIYATTFCDLSKKRIFDIAEGKSSKDLSSYLNSLKGKNQVKVVCMDLSSSYKSIVKKHFPQAQIVVDRFHVVKLAIYRLIQTATTLSPSLKDEKGIIILLRKNRCNLTANQKERLDMYLKENPVVKSVYEHKEEWVELLNKKKMTRRGARPLAYKFFELLDKLKQLPVNPAKQLYKTLDKWKEEIARMWRFSKNNGITEGFHRKMKLIQRAAYGFKTFDNYRKRVIVSCR